MGNYVSNSAAAPDQAAVEEVILRALSLQPQPMTISRLRATVPVPFRGKPATFQACLEPLVESRRVWLHPSGTSAPPLVWDRSPDALAETVICASVTKEPLSVADIEKKTHKKLKGMSPAERRAVVDRLIAEGRLFRWPRKPRVRTDKLGLHPPEPQSYLEPALAAFNKAIVQVATAFAEVGIDPSQTHAAALAAVQAQDWAQDVRTPQSTAQVAVPLDDQALVTLLGERMAMIDPRSRHGAPVLVGDLRPALDFLFPVAADFDAALVRLERAGRVTLLRYDPALAAVPLEPSSLVSDGHATYSGVSLR
jgi:hypothetical protein